MEIWITNDHQQNSAEDGVHDYAFEVPKDGLFEFHLWIISEAEPQVTAQSVDGQQVEGLAAFEDKPGYYRCGSVKLPRGRHLLSLAVEQAPQRLLLSEDADVVKSGKAQLLWDNRTDGQAFDARDAVLTEENRRLLVRHGFLFENERDAQKCEVPAGVPLGGIGAGKVELTSQGFFSALTFNNNQDAPIYRLPGCYFALQVGEGKKSVARLLQTVQVDQLLQPVAAIDADLAFPEARLVYRDPDLPVGIELHAFSSHLPHNPKLSSLPCAFFRFSITNPTAETRTVRLALSWENLINVGGHMVMKNQNRDRLLPLVYHTWNHSFVWSNREVGYQTQSSADGGTGLRFSAKDDQQNPCSFGEHFIWTPDQAAVASDRDLEADERAFTQWLESGCAKGFEPSGTGEFRAGALVVTKEVVPGGSEDIIFVLAWHVPNFLDSYRGLQPNYYTREFGNAEEVAAFVWKHHPTLLARTREVREILELSSLPKWFQRQLLDCRFVANTNTVFLKDGLFSVNEAPTGMAGCLGTLDQRTCAGAYWATFFPEQDAKELQLFTLRQSDDSGPVHDLGFGGFNLAPTKSNWPDLAASYVIQVHRHFLETGDMEFLKNHWPYVCRAVEWTISLDDTGDGIPTLKAGRGTTYDNQHWDGISAFIAGIHEASMTLASDLARRVGENELAGKWSRLADKAHASRMKYLWVNQTDGGYFRNAYDVMKGAADDSCFIASMIAEWAICAGGATPRLPAEKIRLALEGIRRKNMFAHGMADQSARPDNSVFMQYPVAYYGAAALYTGNTDLAWEFLRNQDALVTTPPSTHFNQTLTYDSNGSPGGLPYYMTAPVSWLFLDGITGVVLDVAGKSLRLAPCWTPDSGDWRVPIFTATSWFMLECREAAGRVMVSLRPLKQIQPFGVTRLSLSLPIPMDPASVIVNGKSASVKVAGAAIELAVSFDPGVDVIELTF